MTVAWSERGSAAWTPIPRRAARVLLLDAADRVLLFRGTTRPARATATGSPPAAAWTPGETTAAGAPPGSCARRPGCDVAPAERWASRSGTRSTDFPFDGVWYRQEQDFFVRAGRRPWQVDAGRLRRRSSAAAIDGHRWWSVDGARRHRPTRYYPRGPRRELLREHPGGVMLPRAAHRGPPRGGHLRAGAGPAAARLRRWWPAPTRPAGAPAPARWWSAAAILPADRRGEVPGLADSKLLTAAGPGAGLRRGRRAGRWPTRWWSSRPTRSTGAGCTCATSPAMRRALAALTARPDYVLTDGFRGRRAGRARAGGLEGRPGRRLRRRGQRARQGHPGPDHGRAGPGVPRRTASPSTRDTRPPEHSAALREHGPCPEHRFSYANVAAVAPDAIGSASARRVPSAWRAVA